MREQLKSGDAAVLALAARQMINRSPTLFSLLIG